MAARKCTGLYLMVLVLLSAVTGPAYGLRKFVGGRSQVPNVESNKELQELGRYCVEEFNVKEERDSSLKPLRFSRVVEAEQQIVSGIKYFLRIEVRLGDESTRMFDSIVVVKPWLQSRELLDFSPVANPLLYHSSAPTTLSSVKPTTQNNF